MSTVAFQPENLTLDRLPYRIQQHVDKAFLQSCTLETFEDTVLGSLIVRLSADVLSEKLAEKSVEVTWEDENLVYFARPASWWQHLKLSWNEWFLCRRIARMSSLPYRLLLFHVIWTNEVRVVGFEKTVTVTTEQFALFPESPIRTPEHLRGGRVGRYERLQVSPDVLRKYT